MKGKQKNKFSHLFWRYQKDFYLCSPNGNEGETNKTDTGAMPTSYKAEARCGSEESSLKI